MGLVYFGSVNLVTARLAINLCHILLCFICRINQMSLARSRLASGARRSEFIGAERGSGSIGTLAEELVPAGWTKGRPLE